MINIKLFEFSNKKEKNGRRDIKVILHEIYESDEQYNKNGISWQEPYTSNNIKSVIGTSIKCEFIDDERIEVCGHGDTGVEDNLPVFENASMVGVFTDAYVDTIEINGEKKKVAIGEGYLDSMIYKNFVDSLEEKINNGDVVFGSIEIIGLAQNDNKIRYKDGWKSQGRCPSDYLYSGFALLGVPPADDTAQMLELNNEIKTNGESEDEQMDEKVIAQFVSDIKSTIVETNSKNSEYETKVTELNAKMVELNASVEQLNAALEDVKKERDANYEKSELLYKEAGVLREEIAKAKIKERVGELNSALVDYTDEEKAFAQADIDAFNADPAKYEVNSIVTKIDAEIGKKAKQARKDKEAEVIAEQNAHVVVEDIFGEVVETNSNKDEDTNIF